MPANRAASLALPERFIRRIDLFKMSTAGRILCLLVAVIFLLSFLAATPPASARVLRVLTVTGDWKSQAWYQDTWMGGKQLMRGRFIASKVNEAAPGEFEFTDVTNYTGTEYIDADMLRQYDVLLLADITGWSLPDRFQQGVLDFVKHGGGLIYCASWKWHCTMPRDTPFADALPATFEPVNNLVDDWQSAEYKTPDTGFKPLVVDVAHPVMAGLDWDHCPTLDRAFKIKEKNGAQVLLKAPSGAPILVAGSIGEGRSMISSSIFANDEVSGGFAQNWKDFGRFYAQVFRWLGANAPVNKPILKDETVRIGVNIDYNKALNPIRPAVFSIHAAHDCPDLAPLSGKALENFKALNPEGTFTRMSSNCEPEEGKFDFKRIDSEMAEIRRLDLRPIALFAGLSYGQPKWVWSDCTYGNPTQKAIDATGEEVCKFLEHVNGKGDDPGYKLNVEYVEIGNEPSISAKTIDGYCKLFRAVAQRVHKEFPGVKVGGMGGYEVPYLEWFIDRCGGDVDWISRHPYGWTGEMVFNQEDRIQEYARQKGFKQIQFIVTEWDYWIQGQPKFDYMMKRYFEAVKRDDLLGTLHYRLGQYSEGGYLFGVLWVGWGKEKGAGEKGDPMHDAYDALWSFRDFRGVRVPVQKTWEPSSADGFQPSAMNHLMVDASRNGDALSAVLYTDWAFQAGSKDYGRGANYRKAAVHVRLTFPASNQNRTMTLSSANGEGIRTLGKDVIPAGRTSFDLSLDMEAMTAVSVEIKR